MKRLTDALEALEHLDVQPRPRLVAVVQADSTSTTEPFDGFSRTSFDGFTG